MRAFGAEVVEHGRDFDEARECVEELARARRVALRALRQRAASDCRRRRPTPSKSSRSCPDVDYIFVPVGGGSGAAGCGIVRDGRRLASQGHRRAGARAPMRSRVRGAGRPASTGRAETFAEGIATRTTFDLTFAILKSAPGRCRDAGGGGARGGPVARRCADAQPGRRRRRGGARRRAQGRHPGDARVVCVMTGGNADSANASPRLA